MIQRTHRSDPARRRKRSTRLSDGHRVLRILAIAATMLAATSVTYGSDPHENTKFGAGEATPGNRLGSVPVNDDCINAINLNEPQPGGNDCSGGLPCTITISNELATLDGDAETSCVLDGMPDRCNEGEPIGTTNFGSDIWFSYTTPCTLGGPWRLSMCDDASFDGIIAIYETCDCTPSEDELVGCGDDTCGVEDGPPCVKPSVRNRTCYLIRVGGKFGAQGTGTLSLPGLYEEIDQVQPPMPESSSACDSDADCNDNGANEAYCVESPPCGWGPPGICYLPKNRYLSIARNPSQWCCTARRIKLEGGGAGPWWVGAPSYNVFEWMYFASVSDTPVFAGMGPGAWVDGDWPEVLHVKGCEIAPGHTYVLQAILSGCDEGNELCYSDALELRTASVWGDVVSTCYFDQCEPPQGDPFTQPNIDDVLAEVNAFQGIRNAPLTWLDIDPVYGGGEPEGMWTLIGDVLSVVNAFSGVPYPGLGPLGCP